MAFKMKAGSEGPFRKNFSSAFKDNHDEDPYDENRGTYGTSGRHLKNETYKTRTKYLSWKRNE